jgi:hypothetical protein
VGRVELAREALATPRARSQGGPEQIVQFPVPVALQIVLQIAVRDIGQLTDFEPRPTYPGLESQQHARLRERSH